MFSGMGKILAKTNRNENNFCFTKLVVKTITEEGKPHAETFLLNSLLLLFCSVFITSRHFFFSPHLILCVVWVPPNNAQIRNG